jgi:hypothetical protein
MKIDTDILKFPLVNESKIDILITHSTVTKKYNQHKNIVTNIVIPMNKLFVRFAQLAISHRTIFITDTLLSLSIVRYYRHNKFSKFIDYHN